MWFHLIPAPVSSRCPRDSTCWVRIDSTLKVGNCSYLIEAKLPFQGHQKSIRGDKGRAGWIHLSVWAKEKNGVEMILLGFRETPSSCYAFLMCLNSWAKDSGGGLGGQVLQPVGLTTQQIGN